MPFAYSLVACLMAGIELADVVKIYSRGEVMGHPDLMPINMAHFAAAPPEQQAALNFLTDWIALAKFVVAVGLLGSALCDEPKTRAYFAVGNTVALASYFYNMSPSLHVLADDLKDLPDGSADEFDFAIGAIVVCFAASAAWEVVHALSSVASASASAPTTKAKTS
jgi:hypothetical protein